MISKVMDTTERRNRAETPRAMRRMELARVVDQIDALCDAFGVGSRIPAHRDLMARFDTTERTVLGALAELQRRGRIVRRAGSGTYVATPASSAPETASISAAHATAGERITNVVVVGSHDQGYFSRAIEMAFRHAQEINLGVTYEPPNFERLSTILHHAGTGFVVLGSQNVHDAMQLHVSGHRIVGVGYWQLIDRISFPCVYPDNLTGGYLAATHLIEAGHTRIAYLMAGDNPRLWGHELAVRQASDAGNDVRSVTIGKDTFSEWQQSPALGRAFFDHPDHPTGFCVWNDTDAIRLVTFLMSIGINVPEDVSVVGYDNLPVAQTITPALTTVETRLEDQVKLALNLLASTSDMPRHSIVVEPELVVRNSTRPRQ